MYPLALIKSPRQLGCCLGACGGECSSGAAGASCEACLCGVLGVLGCPWFGCVGKGGKN